MFNDILMSSLVRFNAKTYSCLFHPKNIPVFAYLQMDMIINYFHDIGFSYSYAVTKKKFADQPAQLQKVVKSINNSLKETKRVHFLVMTKWDFDSHFDVVIEIIRKKQSKDRKKHWTKEGYEALELSEECIIKKKQTFKILLAGDIEKDVETQKTIEYHHNRQNNSIVARVIIQNKVEEPQVNVDILKGETVSYDQNVVVNERMDGFCKRQKTITEQGEQIEYEGFQKMSANCIFPNVSYPVLDAPSLQLLCNCFSLDEAGMFALQMGFPLSIKEDLFKAQFPSKELANRLLRIWRGTRHSLDRIKKILHGLARINRGDLVDAFDTAFNEDLPFPENLNV